MSSFPPPPRGADALQQAVGKKFAGAIDEYGAFREEDAGRFEELVATYVEFHRCRDELKARELAIALVRLMAHFELRPGHRGLTPLDSSLDELLDRDWFRPLGPRSWDEVQRDRGLYSPADV